MKMSAAKRAKFNIVTTLLNQLVTTACGIVTPRILIASFGSEVYGISVSIAQFLSYITLLESGIGGVARAELYGPLSRNDHREIGKIYRAITSFFRYVAAAFLAYSIVLGITYRDIAHVTVFSRTYLFFLVIVISLSTLAKYMGGLSNLTLIVADQKQYINNIILIVTTIINTVSVILLTSIKCDILWVKLGSSLIFILRPLFYALYVRKHYSFSRKEKEKAALEQKWTGVGQHIAYFLHMNMDIVLLTLLADVRLVAVYSVYNLVTSSIRALTESFSGGMEAAFGEMIAKNQIQKLRRSYHWYKTLITSVSIVLFGCTGILIVPFVRLYTQGVTDANYIQPAFAIALLLAEAINCLVLPYTSLPIAANHFKQTRWGAYGEAIINLVVSCALINWNPLLGVAIGTVVATAFRGIFYTVYSSKHILRIPVRKTLSHLAVALAVLCLGIWIGGFLIQFIIIQNYFQWVLCGAAAFIAMGVPVAVVARFKMKRFQDEPTGQSQP